MNVSLITILWNGGEGVAGAGRVGSRSGGELLGLCSGLLGWCPLSTSLLAEGVDRGVEGGEEMIRIEGADQIVALELRSDRVLEFGEHEGGAVGVEFLVEVGEHISGGGVDVGHWLCSDEDPVRSWRGLCEAADLVAEGTSVGKEQWCVKSEDHKAWQFLSVGVAVAGRDSQATLGRGQGLVGKATMLVGRR
jgi:hypothetical protein